MPISAAVEFTTVLVVDDDALTLMTAVMTIEDAGYVVISARDAEGRCELSGSTPRLPASSPTSTCPG